MIDNLRGVIISGDGIHVRLIQPSGNEYGNPRMFGTEDEAREWARETRLVAIAGVGQYVAERIGWLKPWELRFY